MKELEIYIHIPFCMRKCEYCDFLSFSGTSSLEREEYVNALVREIYLSEKRMADYEVSTVFIGGGTPSTLKGSMIKKIMKALNECVKIKEDAEVTIECNPGTVDKFKLKDYKEAGINRISFGLQSTNDEELAKLGRIHTFSQFLESYNLAREAGFDNINIDIMSALPYQSLEAYKKTVEDVLALNPEHISAYSLIVEDETPLCETVDEAKRQGKDILPSEDDEREMYYYTKKRLEENGYHQYEISNYAKDDMECKHNVGYWKREDYLGFGLGAASLYQDKRFNNTYDIDQYMTVLQDSGASDDFYGDQDFYQDDIWDISEDTLSVLEGRIQNLTVKDKMEEFMFLGLRMTDGISKEEFNKAFDRNFDAVYGNVVKKLESLGLLIINGDNVKLSKRGTDISNYALSEFLL